MGTTDPSSQAAERVCPVCDYDLRNLTSGRCPECGRELNAVGRTAALSWPHRKQIGLVRAYVWTMFQVMRSPQQVAEESCNPVSFADSQRFRHITVLFAFVPLGTVMLWWYVATLPGHGAGGTLSQYDLLLGSPMPVPGQRLGWVLEAVGVGLFLGLVWLWIFTSVGVPSYFCHPRRLSVTRQNRAIALSYYGCAPLALTPAIAALGVALWLVRHDTGWSNVTNLELDLWILFYALFPLQALSYARGNWVLIRHTTMCGTGRLIALITFVPLTQVLLGVLFLGVLPVIYVYFAQLILSHC